MKLQSGEVICDKCKGSGKSEKYEEFFNKDIYYYKCSKCHGEGKLDWIENVVGKKTIKLNMNGVTWLPPSDVHPKNAHVGQAYVDSNTNECYIFDGTVWGHVVSMTTPL